jgi:hypothetical protein
MKGGVDTIAHESKIDDPRIDAAVAAMKGKAEPILDFVLTPHASDELRRRGLDEAMVVRVLAHPEQRIAVRPGRDVAHSRVELAGKRYLVRVFVDVDRSPQS